jgi:hypothetical protein
MLKDPMFTSADARGFMSDAIRLGEESCFGVTPIHQARSVRGGGRRPPQNPTLGAFCGKLFVLSLLVLGLGVLPGTAQTASSWPQRPLMEATFADSMEYRYLSKQVYESSVVDDMEADGSWSVSGIGTIAYTTQRAKDGKRSLRFRTSMRDEAYLKANRKEGSFAGGQGGNSSARLKLAQPQDWSRFNRISLWVYVHPTSMRTYSFTLGFSCAGAPTGALEPVPTHFVHDLKGGQWNHVVWEIPDYRRDQVAGFAISQTLRGHDPEDEGIVTYDFDQIEVQRVDAEPYEGWEVAPGRIAFQHVGYRPSEEKVAFMSGVSDTQFAVVDAQSDRSAASFPVTTVKNRRGQFQILDFTSFTKPGRYILRCGQVSSRPFAISDDLWYGTIEKALNFYYGQRCGFDVPGVHRACHQDWQGTHEGQTKIINGGWHDAGDLSQGSHRTGMAVYAMLQIYDQLRQRHVRPELQNRVLEEARWGLDWLLKTRFGKGYRITWALGRIYTDNQVGTIDDMVAPAQHVAYENFLFAAVAGYASRVLKDADPQRSRSEPEGGRGRLPGHAGAAFWLVRGDARRSGLRSAGVGRVVPGHREAGLHRTGGAFWAPAARMPGAALRGRHSDNGLFLHRHEEAARGARLSLELRRGAADGVAGIVRDIPWPCRLDGVVRGGSAAFGVLLPARRGRL